MQIYSSILFLLVIFIYSNFYSLKFKIELHKTFLLSIIIIIFLGVVYLKYIYNFNKNNDYFIYLILLIGFCKFFFIKKNLNKVNKLINLEFILFYLFFFLLSQDNYFLDQDEFTYWGKKIKNLNDSGDITYFRHHGYSLDIFRYLFIFFKYNEGLLIFSNNVIIICGFFYLFYNQQSSILKKLLLFFIFTLLINNLSFGFNSIYSDPILAILFASALKFIFNQINIQTRDNKVFLFIFCLMFLFVFYNLNRAAVIYFLFMLLMPIYSFNVYKNQRILFTVFNFTSILFLIEHKFQIIQNKVLKGHYMLEDIIKIIFNEKLLLKFQQLFDLLFTPIYFSSFGISINTITNYLFSIDSFLPVFKIYLISYIFFLFFLIYISRLDLKTKNEFFLYYFSLILIYCLVVIVLKHHLEMLSMLALTRYIGILVLALFLFTISILVQFNKLFSNISYLTILIIPLFLVTPNKTFGFFVPDKIYYSNKINLDFKKNRFRIANLNAQSKIYKEFILIHSKNKSDLTNLNFHGYHTFYHDIISYEIFPKRYLSFEHEEFKNKIDHLKFDNKDTLVILFDLNEEEKFFFKKFNNTFEVNTY